MLCVRSSKNIGDAGDMLDRLGGLDIYYHPKYLHLSELAGEGEGFLAYYEGKEGKVLYPFLKRKVPDFLSALSSQYYYDIFSPYGYSGPYFKADDSSKARRLAKRFYEEFDKYCEEQLIVSEFIRFHPLLENHKYFCPQNSVHFNNLVVYFDLSKSECELYNGLANSTKRNIKKAERSNLSFHIDQDLEYFGQFTRLYNKTMDRVGATEFYYFNNRYFDYLKQAMKDYCFVGVVLNNHAVVIASALFFNFGKIVQYHLGSSDPKFLKSRPNDLLFYKAALWAKKSGFAKFHLGGGHSKERDSLFHFKASFSKDMSKFYIARLIRNETKYDELKKAWINQKDKKEEVEKAGFFPIYGR